MVVPSARADTGLRVADLYMSYYRLNRAGFSLRTLAMFIFLFIFVAGRCRTNRSYYSLISISLSTLIVFASLF